jgi:hypothetical protein
MNNAEIYEGEQPLEARKLGEDRTDCSGLQSGMSALGRKRPLFLIDFETKK